MVLPLKNIYNSIILQLYSLTHKIYIFFFFNGRYSLCSVESNFRTYSLCAVNTTIEFNKINYIQK